MCGQHHGYNIITSFFGYRDSPFGNDSSTYHTGIDIGAPEGANIVSITDGVVILAGWNGGHRILFKN